MSVAITHIDRITKDDGSKTISVSYSRDDKPITISCPETPEILSSAIDFADGIISDEEFIKAVAGFDIVKAYRDAIAPKIEQISENLTFDGCHVYYRNKALSICIDEILEDHLVRLIKAGTSEADLSAWAAFTERLYGNECKHTRKNIVQWLIAQDWLTLDPKGRLIGYRGCAWDYDRDCPISVHSGTATVDGVQVEGQIPNPVGSIVEMPRKKVQHDPSIGCSSGLHVGTYDYAKNWAPADGAVIRVAVAPEDIVSVPTECSYSKIRCCRFEVLDCTRCPDQSNYENDLTYRYDNDEILDEGDSQLW